MALSIKSPEEVAAMAVAAKEARQNAEAEHSRKVLRYIISG